MTVVTLSARGTGAASGDAPEELTPERLAEASGREVARLGLRMGRRRVDLGELFDVRLEARDAAADGAPELRIETGDLRLDGLGAGMRAGRLVVEGDAGDRLGAGMSGGEIRVGGSCGDWAAAAMSGGLLRVEGNAGNRAGGALAGAPRGMTGGTLLIGGSAGEEVGATMRRGVVAVAGSVGPRAGFHAIAGTVLVLGDAGEAPALATKRGTLAVFGRVEPLPTFRLACEYAPAWLRLYLRHLRDKLGFPVPDRFLGGRFRRFAGDFSQLGKGEILQWRET